MTVSSRRVVPIPDPSRASRALRVLPDPAEHPQPDRQVQPGRHARPGALEEPGGATSTTVPGAWVEGDPVGRRRFVEIGDLELDSGVVLPQVRLAYETWGELEPGAGNVVLVEHALTGDSHMAGPADDAHPSPGWWDALIAEDGPVDLASHVVVAINVLGGCQGSTGPASQSPDGSRWGSRFPAITIRDQVRAEARALDVLGVARLAAVIGGSMGGMRAIEWAVGHPDRVERCIVLASTAQATADQIAWCQPQVLAIRLDPDFHGGDYYGTGSHPHAGMGIARRIAHTTYRTEHELSERFGRTARDEAPGSMSQSPSHRPRFEVESYLDHHANKLDHRFDANSYIVLTEAMNTHDVGRDRGGLEAALGQVRARCTIVAVDSDRLYVPRLSEQMARLIPDARLTLIRSEYGHDGFLIEQDQVGRIIADALAE